jgi:hypothetical protein
LTVFGTLRSAVRSSTVALALVVSALAGCGGESAPKDTKVLLAAGDIADCGVHGDEATAKLVEDEDGVVAALGDNAYESGTREEYAQCYGPSWGRFKSRTRPAIGGHEYIDPATHKETGDGAAYFDYFASRAGPRGKGYYSYDLGKWHIVVINAVCDKVGGCGKGSPQERWLRADLAGNAARCTLAYWHDPRFSSGRMHGNAEFMQPIWQTLYEQGADVVVNGHEHNYERFAPQRPDGTLDYDKGIVEFLAGTGGRSHYPFAQPQPNSLVRNSGTYGVLKLSLRPQGYDWRFLAVPGAEFGDAGSGDCH